MTNPKDKEEKKKVIFSRVPPELHKKARIKAVQEGRSIDEVVRELIAEWVKDSPQPQE